MRITGDLQRAIEDLYSIFGRYALRSDTHICLHCHTEQDERRVHLRPLRQLRAEDLRQYASSSLYTWGTEEDFKHFLPRLLELTVEAVDLDFEDPQTIFRKLPYASWWMWPETERLAITRFVRAVWLAALSTPPEELGFYQVKDWICSIAQFEEDLGPYLADWIAADSAEAHRNLAYFILNDLSFSGKVPAGYWEDRRQQWQQLVSWCQTFAIRQKLERGI
jgi:hypothetical protein